MLINCLPRACDLTQTGYFISQWGEDLLLHIHRQANYNQLLVIKFQKKMYLFLNIFCGFLFQNPNHEKSPIVYILIYGITWFQFMNGTHVPSINSNYVKLSYNWNCMMGVVIKFLLQIEKPSVVTTLMSRVETNEWNLLFLIKNIIVIKLNEGSLL